MPDLWMPGATRLDIGDHAPTDGGTDKAIAHITWDRNATAAKPLDLVAYENLVDYFGRNPAGKGAAPHILWDPFTGRFTQFVPATSRSRSVVDLPGDTRTNRAGDQVIQIEALFFPYCRVDGKVYARLADTPCKGWSALNAWVRSWGIPDRWPMGKPTSFTSDRSEKTWETTAGWFGHSQVPENDHTDPGSWPDFVKPPTTTPPKYEPFPGASFFMSGGEPAIGKFSPIFTAMGEQLEKRGFGRYYKVGPGPHLGQADVNAYQAYQRSLGYTGASATWPPGPTSWNKLQVPNV